MEKHGATMEKDIKVRILGKDFMLHLVGKKLRQFKIKNLQEINLT